MDHLSAVTARARALAMLEMFFSCKAMDDVVECSREPSSQKEMGALALDNVFPRLWTKPQLDRRARNLLTPAILIALG
jgi:4-carboxymuconolactone decarboxylase